MKRRCKKRMLIAIGIMLGLTIIVTIFFLMPYSKTKTEFNVIVNNLTTKTDRIEGVFKEEDIAGLPAPLFPSLNLTFSRYYYFCDTDYLIVDIWKRTHLPGFLL